MRNRKLFKTTIRSAQSAVQVFNASARSLGASFQEGCGAFLLFPGAKIIGGYHAADLVAGAPQIVEFRFVRRFENFEIGGTQGQQVAAPAIDFRIELGVGHNRVGQSPFICLLGAIAPAEHPHFAGAFVPHHVG